MYDITLQQITAFLKTAECGSFTRAAGAMYISQPALSRIVSRFEKAVGARLFLRGAGGAVLTDKGRELYDGLAPLYKSLAELIGAAGEGGGNKTLKIACHTSFDLKEPIDDFRLTIARFKEKYPDAAVTIELFELTELKDSLLGGDIDLIHSISSTFENLQSLSYKVLEDIPVYIAMSAGHPLASEQVLTPERVSGEVFYFISSMSAERHLEQCRRLGVLPGKVVLLRNYPSVIMEVRQGKGVTLCGIDVKYSYGADIEFFELSGLREKPQMLLAWNPKNKKPALRDFLQMLP